MSRRHSIAHVPGLDGLRGLAVIGVLLFHANGMLRGGYLGVDLFFVLSGFLITSILIEEHRGAGRIDLKAFWIRRARRLFPALLSLMPAVALYAKTIAAPGELASLRADAIATIAYVANWRAIFAKRSYWDMFAAPSPLEHTWSLAIEEQFYVLWPLLVVGVLAVARGRVRAVFAMSVGLALASCASMAMLYDGGVTTRVYLGTDTRGAAILFGAALSTSGLAQPAPVKSPRVLDAFGVLAALGLGFAWWSLDGQSELLYRGGFWATELAGLVLVLCCVRVPEGLVSKALSVRPLRAMGQISYGVYLWHWPIYVVLTEERLHVGGVLLLAIRLTLTLAIAAASFKWFEKPIRERGLSWGRPIVVVPSAVALALVLVVGTTRAVPVVLAPVAKESPPPPPPAAPDASAPPPLRVLVVGDSVGLALGARMFWAQEWAHAAVEQRSVGDCSILDGVVPVHSMSGEPHGNGNCARSWVMDAKEVHPDVTAVVLGGAYFSLVKSGGRWRGACDPGWRDAYRKELTRLLESLAPVSKRTAVILAAYPVGKWQKYRPNEKVDCYNGTLRDAARAADAEIIDLNAYACPEGTCTLTSRDAPVRPDGLHFDGLGAEDTSRWVLTQLRGADGGP